MNPLRLLRTSAVRYTLAYVLAYGVLLALAGGALLWTMTRSGDPKLGPELAAELAELRALDEAALIAELDRRGREGLEDGAFYLLWGEDGAKRAGNLLMWPEESDLESSGDVGHAWFDEDAIPGDRYEDETYLPYVAVTRVDGSRLLLARAVDETEGVLDLTEYLAEVLSAAMALSLLLGITLGRSLLGRVDAIGRTAEEIMAGDLSRRVPVGARGDEFDTLATRLNAMLDRIQQLIRGIRDVTDNIAHDLRSPLTRLRNRMEVALLEERTGDEYRQALQQGIEDADSLIKTFNALLSIAQAEAGNHRSEWGPVDLGELARDLSELYVAMAEDSGQRLTFSDGGDAVITGSRDLIAQAMGNLLENALKYTPEGGDIALSTRVNGSWVEIVVADSGAGIPASDRERVFERFVRLESSRHTPGNGLGLSLVRAVARLHRADLRLEDHAPGLRVVVRFPKQPARAASPTSD